VTAGPIGDSGSDLVFSGLGGVVGTSRWAGSGYRGTRRRLAGRWRLGEHRHAGRGSVTKNKVSILTYAIFTVPERERSGTFARLAQHAAAGELTVEYSETGLEALPCSAMTGVLHSSAQLRRGTGRQPESGRRVSLAAHLPQQNLIVEVDAFREELARLLTLTEQIESSNLDGTPTA